MVDDWLNTRFALNRVGGEIASRLDGTRDLEAIAVELASLHSIGRDRAWLDLTRFLAELDTHAMLVVRPSGLREKVATARLWLLHPQAGTMLLILSRILGDDRPPAKRFRGNVSGVVAGTTRSQMAPLAILLVVSGLSAIIAGLLADLGNPAVRAAARALFLSPVVIVVVHYLLLYAHELGHLRMLHQCKVRVRYTILRGFRVGVAHDPATLAHERWVSIAGPTAALVLGALLSVLFWLTPWRAAYFPQVMAGFPIVLGMMHVLTLVPGSADGRHLFRRSRAKPPARAT